MKTILHFHPDESYSKKFVYPLILEEKKAGFKTYIVNSKTNLELKESIQIKFNLFSVDFFNILIAIYQIIKLLTQMRPDIVISHNSLSSSIPITLAKLFRIKRIIYFNHGVPSLGYGFPLKIILEFIEKINCAFADEILTVSKDMKASLAKITKKNVNLIGEGSCCGIDLNEYSRKKYAFSGFRRNHKIKKTDFLIVFIGRPVFRKGYNNIITLWENKFKDKANFKLLLCGSSISNANKLICDIPSNIIFMGFTEEIPEILASADVLILPSRHEGLPYAVLESMASECPVIATNIPGIRCLIDDKKSGLLLSIGKSDIDLEKKLYDMILLLKRNKSLSKFLTSNALKTSKKFSRELFMQRYIRYIQKKVINKVEV